MSQVEIEPLAGVDAPTRQRANDTHQIAIIVDGVRVGVVHEKQGATVFIFEDIEPERIPPIEKAIREKLAHLNIKQIKTLPPKPTFKRARASDF